MPITAPNRCQILRAAGTNQYGERQLGRAEATRCAVVHLKTSREKSSVRSDTSASGGAAAEPNDTASLLFRPNVKPKVGDKVILDGFELRIVVVEPRYQVSGPLDHYQVACDEWSEGA